MAFSHKVGFIVLDALHAKCYIIGSTPGPWCLLWHCLAPMTATYNYSVTHCPCALVTAEPLRDSCTCLAPEHKKSGSESDHTQRFFFLHMAVSRLKSPTKCSPCDVHRRTAAGKDPILQNHVQSPPAPAPPLVQATVTDQKLMEPTPSVAWTRVLLPRRDLRDTRVGAVTKARHCQHNRALDCTGNEWKQLVFFCSNDNELAQSAHCTVLRKASQGGSLHCACTARYF